MTVTCHSVVRHIVDRHKLYRFDGFGVINEVALMVRVRLRLGLGLGMRLGKGWG